MTNQILISFCNLPIPKDVALVFFEILRGNHHCNDKPIPINFPPRIKSATGIARGNEYIFLLFMQYEKSFIAILDADNFHLHRFQELPEVIDPHSMLFIDSEFFIVSTGTDEIIQYNLSKNNELVNPNQFWRASQAKADTHHVNSILFQDGDIIVSAFGQMEGKGWPSAKNGYLYNVTRNEIMKKGIYHPHTLSARNGKIYYCESKKSEFHALGENEPLIRLEGYTRGVAWLTDYLVCVASSNRGVNTRFRRILTRLTNRDFIRGSSRIYLLDVQKNQIMDVIDLSQYGPEVYDVVALS